MNVRLSLLLLLSFLLAAPRPAQAYCRTRTCDADNTCEIADGCSIGGKKARWPNGCLTFAIQRDGSALQGISADDARKVAENAFALWTDSACFQGGSPPLSFHVQPDVRCRDPEYNCHPDDWNANVIMFQDEGWQHGPSTLAVTCVTMNLNTGEILDADMEINTTPPYFDFALPGGGNGADLHTVLTHEAGHFLGLNHSDLHGAVMYEFYDDQVLISSLSDDDVAGVCDIYGHADDDPKCRAPELPDNTRCVGASECVPTKKGTEGCTCTVPGGTLHSRPTTLPWLALVGAAARSRRLRRRIPAK